MVQFRLQTQWQCFRAVWESRLCHPWPCECDRPATLASASWCSHRLHTHTQHIKQTSTEYDEKNNSNACVLMETRAPQPWFTWITIISSWSNKHANRCNILALQRYTQTHTHTHTHMYCETFHLSVPPLHSSHTHQFDAFTSQLFANVWSTNRRSCFSWWTHIHRYQYKFQSF